MKNPMFVDGPHLVAGDESSSPVLHPVRDLAGGSWFAGEDEGWNPFPVRSPDEGLFDYDFPVRTPVEELSSVSVFEDHLERGLQRDPLVIPGIDKPLCCCLRHQVVNHGVLLSVRGIGISKEG
ncbi:MAG: hypothetical protein SPK80_01740, partial [Bacteroidales bacterium]|nr:hypothetical protein [Bacteroidales bacterium]